MPFRPGSKNGHTVYYETKNKDLDYDYFVGTAMSPEAANAIAEALNNAPPLSFPLETLPRVPKRK